MLYQSVGNKIQCNLCSHYCNLKPDQTGICGVNQNSNSKIINLVHSKVSAINIDPIEKKPLYHFLPSSKSLSIGTLGCNFRCSFCQNHSISQEHNIAKYSQQISPQEIVHLAIKHRCKSISYTYNEPTIFYPFVRDIVGISEQHNIKNIMVSNGMMSSEVIQYMNHDIDAINIDLKSFDPKYYQKTLKGKLSSILENIKTIANSDIHLEITTLVIPNINDSDDELRQIASFIASIDTHIPWHISAFHPDYKMLDNPPTPIKTLQKAYSIGKTMGLHYVYMGNVSTPSSTICPTCNTLVLQRIGHTTNINTLSNGSCSKCNTRIIK